MFTGIIEETGSVLRIGGSGRAGEITVRAREVLKGTRAGDSIAVNGVCLTVTGLTETEFTADVMPETLRRSSLGALRAGSRVNLERAMAADGRFGGHIVSGHIDGTGTILSTRREENAVWIEIGAEEGILELIVEKGSICVDGISLTAAKREERSFAVSIIPHTGSGTTLLDRRPGERVNLETDIIGKYVRALLAPRSGGGQGRGLTEEYLRSMGY